MKKKKQNKNKGNCLETSRGKMTLLMIHLKHLNSLAAVCLFFLFARGSES